MDSYSSGEELNGGTPDNNDDDEIGIEEDEEEDNGGEIYTKAEEEEAEAKEDNMETSDNESVSAVDKNSSLIKSGGESISKAACKKRKTKKEIVINHPKKIGPQKQKKMIHTLLKKAKVYEIRKLTRRIDALRKLKGTEQQIAKNKRKSEKLIKEIDAMKGFIISTLTERTVDIFKGIAEQMYMDIWTASQEQKTMELMLQNISNNDQSEDTYLNIAYLRMLSSKDIVGRLKLIDNGTNIIEMKIKKGKAAKKLLKKQVDKSESSANLNDKSIAKKKKNDSGTNLGKGEDTDKEERFKIEKENVKVQRKQLKTPAIDISDNKKINVSNNKDVTDQQQNQINEKKIVTKTTKSESVKKSKKISDSFFLDHHPEVSDDSDEEFSAPVKKENPPSNDSFQTRNNRMGQRQRKQLVERKLGKVFGNKNDRDFSKNRSSYNRGKSSNHIQQRSFANKPKPRYEKKELDIKTLHPSWQAKQKQKSQQTILPFSGTKITFDD